MTVRLGLIGCGRISHAHGIAVGRIGAYKVRFVACSDVRQEAAFARAYGCDKAYDDAAQMLAEEKLDAVVLATWPAQHREQVEMCLEAGHKFILCEKALATSGLKRASAAPDLPTIAESGVPGYEANNWWALAAPAGTPPGVVSKLSAEVAVFLKAPETLKRFQAEGVEAQARSPADMQKMVQSEIAKWRNVAKVANIRTE